MGGVLHVHAIEFCRKRRSAAAAKGGYFYDTGQD